MLFLTLCLNCVYFTNASKLMLILMDGFRWDYFDLPDVAYPGFNTMFQEGVRTKYLIPDFPTDSYPNYYSIMTGLHCENHGMVGNFMYDAPTRKSFLIGGNPDQYLPIWWDDGEPLWVTAEKQNKKAYLYDWPGCEVTIRGVNSTYCKPYTKPTFPKDLRHSIDEGIQLLKNNSADIVGIYMEAIDKYGHQYGASSDKLKQVLRETDREIGSLMSQLKSTGLIEDVNVMIFSDHGMTNWTNIVNLTNVIHSDDVLKMMMNSACLYIWPKSGKRDKIYQDVIHFGNPNIRIYKKEELPEDWFLKQHKRTPPLMIVADFGTIILSSENPTVYEYSSGPIKGVHGYEKHNKDMRAIFLATGPAFKRNYVAKEIKNVELYQVMCNVLGIEAAPHNGTWQNVEPMMKSGGASITVAIFILSIIVYPIHVL